MKIDINVKKEATINTGNYSSIKPSVSITLKDIDVNNSEKVYKNLNILTAAFFFNELSVLTEIQNNIKTDGLRKLLSSLEIEEVEKDMKQAIKELHDDLFTL